MDDDEINILVHVTNSNPCGRKIIMNEEAKTITHFRMG